MSSRKRIFVCSQIVFVSVFVSVVVSGVTAISLLPTTGQCIVKHISSQYRITRKTRKNRYLGIAKIKIILFFFSLEFESRYRSIPNEKKFFALKNVSIFFITENCLNSFQFFCYIRKVCGYPPASCVRRASEK